MYNVELDIAAEDDNELDFFRALAVYGITILEYQQFGPGGGNPMFVIGHHDKLYLKAFVLREYDPEYEFDEFVAE